MKAYSVDLRERVAQACDSGQWTQEQIAQRFSVSDSFIRRLLKRRAREGTLAPKPHAGGFASAVDSSAREILGELVQTQPDATLEELRQGLARRGGPLVCVARVCQVLAEMKLVRKKSPRRPASGIVPT